MSSLKRLNQPGNPRDRDDQGAGAAARPLAAYPLPRLSSVRPYAADPNRTAWEQRATGGAAGRARDYYFA